MKTTSHFQNILTVLCCAASSLVPSYFVSVLLARLTSFTFETDVLVFSLGIVVGAALGIRAVRHGTLRPFRAFLILLCTFSGFLPAYGMSLLFFVSNNEMFFSLFLGTSLVTVPACLWMLRKPKTPTPSL